MKHDTYPTPEDQLSDSQRLLLLITTVVGHAIKHVFSAAYFVLLPDIKAGLFLSNTQVGMLSTIRQFASGVAVLPAGFAGDQFKRQRALILGLTLVSVGIFGPLLGLATNFVVAAVASGLLIMSITFWHPLAIAALAESFPKKPGFAIGLHGTGASMGEALGPILTGLLLTLFRWRVILLGSALPAVLFGGVVWLLLRTLPMSTSGTPSLQAYATSVRRVLANRRVGLVLLLSSGYGASQSIALTFLPIYVREDLGASSLTLGLYLSMAQVAGIGSNPTMGYLSDRIGRKTVLVPGLILLGSSLLLMNLLATGWPFFFMIIVMGAFVIPLMSIFIVAATDLVSVDIKATTISMVFGAAVVIAAVAPLIAGIFADAYGVKSTLLWASVAAFLTAFFAVVTDWEKEPKRLGLPS